MEELLVIVVSLIFFVVFVYPLFLVLSIAGLLRKYLKCKIRESEYNLFILSNQQENSQ